MGVSSLLLKGHYFQDFLGGTIFLNHFFWGGGGGLLIFEVITFRIFP